jgi:transcriptional regulator with XRE-family HTH domain
MDRSGRTILARNLKGLRTLHELTQEDVAGAAQIDRTYVSMIENSRYAATVDMLDKLASVFGVQVDEMLRADTLENAQARLGK